MKGTLAYLGLAFGLAWLAWEIPIRLLGAEPGPASQLILLPGGLAPAVAAFIVRRLVTREGFADTGLRPNLRRSWRVYLVAWLHPLAVIGVVVILAAGLGVSQPDLTLGRALDTLAPGVAPARGLPPALWLIIPVQLLITSVVVSPLLFGEEFGWRGYLQPRLFPGKPIAAAVATGLIWSAWHLPLNLRGYNDPSRSVLGLIAFTGSCIFLSLIFGWVHNRAGSIWAPSLAHAASNSLGGSIAFLLFVGGPNWVWVSYVGLLAWIPMTAFCAWILLRGGPREESSVVSHQSSV
jgi:membrane protease YdiL (CAAX protease family)